MNTIITLTNGQKIDVKDVISYKIDSTILKIKCIIYLKSSRKPIQVSPQDIDCIEKFRRELSDIEKNEE